MASPDKDLKNLAHAAEEVPEEWEALKAWWNRNGNIVTIALIAVLAVVVGVRFWNSHRAKVESEALAAVAAAGNDIPALEAVIGNDASQKATVQARLRLIDIHFQNGDWKQGEDGCKAFLAAYPDHPFADIAAIGVAHAEEAQGNLAEAIKAYEVFLEGGARASSFLAKEAQIGHARCLILQGSDQDREQASKELGLVLSENPNSEWGRRADELIKAKNRLAMPSAESEAILSSELFENPFAGEFGSDEVPLASGEGGDGDAANDTPASEEVASESDSQNSESGESGNAQ